MDQVFAMRRNAGDRGEVSGLVAAMQSTAIGTLLLAVVFAVLWFPRTSMALVRGEKKISADDGSGESPSLAANLVRQGAILLVTCVVFGVILGNVFVVLAR